MPQRPLLLLVCLLVGCDSTQSDSPQTDAPQAPAVTWHEHVRPLLDKHCTRCHQPDGIGVDFTSYDVVSAVAPLAVDRMNDGEMPPPAADPSCRDYEGSDHMILPDAGRDLFAEWVDLDTPLGDPADAPGPAQAPPNELQDPDLELRIPTPYTPSFSDVRNPNNEYRCFYLDHGQDKDFFITGQHPLVNQTMLLHHAVLLKAPKSKIPADYDPAVGADCIDNTMVQFDNMVGGWAPGMSPTVYDEGFGLRVSKDDVLVLQFHYFYPGAEADGVADQSGYALKIAPAVNKELRMIPLGLYDFDIPAGKEAHTESTDVSLPVPFDITVHGVFPHLHQLGAAYKAWYTRDGEQRCIVQSDRWDFSNQLYYQFKEPIVIEPGDSMGVSCTWNNSTSNPDRPLDVPQDTGYGERTDEEMCFMFTLISF